MEWILMGLCIGIGLKLSNYIVTFTRYVVAVILYNFETIAYCVIITISFVGMIAFHR